MQVNEKKPKRVGQEGVTYKRFKMRTPHNKAVASFQKILAAQKDQDINWEQALEYLIETHPKTKKLMPL